MTAHFKRKRIRLPPKEYVGRRWYFVTLCCERRRPFFTIARRAQWLLDELRRHASRSAFAVHAYCVMPDHVHLLIEGLQGSSNLQKFVGALKQETAFLAAKCMGAQIWQRFFYDHILRRTDAPDSVAWYIWMNPVRKDLCSTPWDYPFSGSFTLDWKRSRPVETTWVPPWKKRVAG